MGMHRRLFVRQGALALLALGLPPEYVTRWILRERGRPARKKTLVCIFQRGAVDGLSMVVPFGEPEYSRRRRSIVIPSPTRGADDAALDLDGFFGLHPALAPLHDLYGRRELAVIHAVGSPHPTRSHFEAQDYMETATPGRPSTRDGWLNRVLTETGCDCGRTLDDPAAHAADHAAGQSGVLPDDVVVPALRGVAMGASLPLVLRGDHPALAIQDLARFGIAGGRQPGLESTFDRLYRTEGGDLVTAAGDEGLDAVRALQAADPARYAPADGVEYPRGDFGRSLRQIAQLIKADVGVEVAFADIGGWDTHVGQGGARGQLALRLGELARGIRALHDDLGDRVDDVVILTMSEFGRTVAENGSGGTDHGHANCMLALGGGVRGGRIVGRWPGLAREQLWEGRDLAVTTDFRDVFAEVAGGHLGAEKLGAVFPGYELDPARRPGLLG